ncbi:MAG: hypothetical protein WC604_01395 [Candidatus Gracilibacteria bacterium]
MEGVFSSVYAFISEFFRGLFFSMNDPEFVTFLLMFLIVDFLVFSSVLMKWRFKAFFIFWAVVIALSLLGMLLSFARHCSGEQCLGNAMLFMYSFIFLVPNIFIPLFVLLFFKLFKVDKFWKVVVASLTFGCVVFGILFGLKVLADEEDENLVVHDQVTEKIEATDVKAPSVTPIDTSVGEEEVGEEVGVEVESEAVQITPDEENIELIKKYYGELWVDELEEAYAMKYEPKESFKTFEGWYKNTLYAAPSDFEGLGENKYSFVVDLMEDDGGNERYNVTMQVIDGKLKTISSKEITSLMIDAEKVFDSSLKACAKWENGDEKLYVVRNGVEVLADSIVEKSDDLSSKFESFEDLKFSKSGRYLMYKIPGWEGEWLKVYDTVDLKMVHVAGAAGGLMGLTDDEKHFYQCEGTGMAGGFIEVYSVPGFELEENLFQLHAGDDVGAGGRCIYDSATNSLKYDLWIMGSDPAIDPPPWYTYYFEE